MRYLILTLFLLSTVAIGCHMVNAKQKANLIASDAMLLYSRNSKDPDSVSRALFLLDSALSVTKISTIYLLKYEIQRNTNKLNDALRTCDSVLSMDSNNFVATFDKALTYDALGSMDSSKKYYLSALHLAENKKTFNSSDIVRDHEKIIIVGLLGDTTAFKRMIDEFESKYEKSGNKFFPNYVEEFQNFKRDDYLHGN